MTDRGQLLAVAASAAVLVAVIELVRRRKLTEEYSFFWILLPVAVLAMLARRDVVQTVGAWIGTSSALATFAVLLLVVGVMASLGLSVIVSHQRQQIERLIEQTAVLEAELRDLRAQQREHPDEAPRRPARSA